MTAGQTSPEIKVIGLYRPNLDPSRCQKFIADYLATMEGVRAQRLAEIEQELRFNLQGVALVEVLVTNPDGRFSMDGFMQADPDLSEDQWQAAWREIYLSTDGTQQIGVGRHHPDIANFRAAFYVHFWNENLGLQSSYGALSCPPVEPIPERLWKLVPYDLVD